MSYIGKQPTIGNFVKLDTITTSATTTFNLLSGGVAYSPQSANHCIVSLNGVIQSPNTSFTISGSTIVFASALTASDVIDFILVLGDVLNIGTPSDATVTFPKVTSNLITGATAETSIDGADSILIYDDSATALRKMTRTNFVAGVGGTNTPAFQASMSTDQTISANTYVKINFDTEDYDIGGCYNNTSGTVTLNGISTPSYSFAPNTAGKYLITASINSQTSTDFDAFITSVFKNGTQVSRAINSNRHFDSALHTYIVTANGTSDYFDIRGYTEQSGGSTLESVESGTILAWFNATKLIGV